MRETWQALKSGLGPIQLLDFTRFDLAHAHRELGKHVSEQVWRILDWRLENIKPRRLVARNKQAIECWYSLQKRSNRQDLAEPLRIAIGEYLVCLEAWADGLDLTHYSHPALKVCTTDGGLPTPIQLALVLQHDSVGCQTGLYRCSSQEVQVWHTEEDVDGRSGSRFDCLRVASFQAGADNSVSRFHTFIYPDLMPGPSFGWRDDGYIQAVDTLLMHNPPQVTGGMLANVVCWLALRLGMSIKTADMLESLRPFLDGYAMNLVWPENQTVRAARYEFAGDRVIKSDLAGNPGSFLFHVNTFSDRTDAGLQAMEALPGRTNYAMSKRIDRTIQALEAIRLIAKGAGLQPRHLFRLITSRAGGKWAYANKDVKAYFLSQVKPNELEIWLGTGPAGREYIPLKINQQI
jgi:hypothetical protein